MSRPPATPRPGHCCLALASHPPRAVSFWTRFVGKAPSVPGWHSGWTLQSSPSHTLRQHGAGSRGARCRPAARSLREAHVLLLLPTPPPLTGRRGVAGVRRVGVSPKSRCAVDTELRSQPAQSLHLQTRSLGPHSRKAQTERGGTISPPGNPGVAASALEGHANPATSCHMVSGTGQCPRMRVCLQASALGLVSDTDVATEAASPALRHRADTRSISCQARRARVLALRGTALWSAPG